MKDNNDGQKPIWLTELGLSADASDPKKAQQQAEYLRKVYTRLIKHPKVDKIFWYNFRCKLFGDPQEDNLGIVNRDFTPKPAYITLSQLPKVTVRKINPQLAGP